MNELAAGLADLLERACAPEVVRAAWPGGDPGRVGELWRRLADVGLFALLVPEEAGGLGLDETALVAAVEETGYAGVPGPVVETVAFAAPLLAAAGRDALLDGVLAGRAVVTARLGPGPVPYAQLADAALVGTAGEVRLVELTPAAGAGGVRPIGPRGAGGVRPVEAVDGSRGAGGVRAVEAVDGSRGLGEVRGAGEPLGIDAAVAAERAALATAAQLVGLARRLLDMTAAYVRERRQFGRPVGSFQAVQHALADALLGLEFARPPVLRAARSLAAGRKDAPAHVSMAKALAADAAETVARAALQAHGAIAYTVEYDLHLYAKRVWAVAQDWGGAAYHRERVALHLALPHGRRPA